MTIRTKHAVFVSEKRKSRYELFMFWALYLGALLILKGNIASIGIIENIEMPPMLKFSG